MTPHKQAIPITARGILKEIFETIALTGMPWAEVSRQVGLHYNTILRFRSGRSEPTFFELECLAQLAGMQLTLSPVRGTMGTNVETLE